MPDIVTTFLELGDATSRNLEFAHRPDVSVSYGEETITENNLLEIRRRHPHLIYLKTFPKQKESKCGADWEWHVIGRRYTARMRVQAKRVQRNGNLKIKHRVRSSGRQQRDLLLTTANSDKMKPVYCFYCTEPQRSIWKQWYSTEDYEQLQTGCLLADANLVPEATTNLKQIEDVCIPWHYLFKCADFARIENEHPIGGTPDLGYLLLYVLTASDANDRWRASGWNVPTIEALNGKGDGEFDRTGVVETKHEDLPIVNTVGKDRLEPASDETHQEMGMSWIMLIDVRDEPTVIT